jgi:hypothetical protein
VTAGSSALSSWTLTWSFPNGQVVNAFWGGKLTQNGSTVTATPESWNGSVPAGGSTTLGFLAGWNGTNGVPAVSCTAS